MLSRNQEKLIRSLHTKKGRREHGLTLVEGIKQVEDAGSAIEWTFGPEDTDQFEKLTTTETPQHIVGVARIPQWSSNDVLSKPILLVLDHIQDPGNVGALLRLAAGFQAGIIAVESADISSPKVVRASSGALFFVPWITTTPEEAESQLADLTSTRQLYRLEKRKESISITKTSLHTPCILIAGSEGRGISLTTPGTSIMIPHDPLLESLNVTHATAIALWSLYQNRS